MVESEEPGSARSRHVSVVVRLRPLVELERSRGAGISGNWVANIEARCLQDQCTGDVWNFDHVFGPSDSTSRVFQVCGRSVVDSFCEGYNGTIFAYGQTASGKTFTMQGDGRTHGIIPLAVNEIFAQLGRTDHQYHMYVSYLEIYNEQVFDLLGNSSTEVRVLDTLNGPELRGLGKRVTTGPEDILACLASGEHLRHVGGTNMNERSSRSHTILQVTLESEHMDRTVTRSILNLVDLAGSEGLRHTAATGERRREGQNINRSLFALSQVINALADSSKGKAVHIRFRDSKLTRILQPSLGGNAQTLIVCAISPAEFNYTETKSTLEFASRAKCVRNRVSLNVFDSRESIIRRNTEEIAVLKEKLEDLRKSPGPEFLRMQHENQHLMEMKGLLEHRVQQLQSCQALQNDGDSKDDSRSGLEGDGDRTRRHTLGGWMRAEASDNEVGSRVEKCPRLQCALTRYKALEAELVQAEAGPTDSASNDSFDEGGHVEECFGQDLSSSDLLKVEADALCELSTPTASPERFAGREGILDPLEDALCLLDKLLDMISEGPAMHVIARDAPDIRGLLTRLRSSLQTPESDSGSLSPASAQKGQVLSDELCERGLDGPEMQCDSGLAKHLEAPLADESDPCSGQAEGAHDMRERVSSVTEVADPYPELDNTALRDLLAATRLKSEEATEAIEVLQREVAAAHLSLAPTTRLLSVDETMEDVTTCSEREHVEDCEPVFLDTGCQAMDGRESLCSTSPTLDPRRRLSGSFDRAVSCERIADIVERGLGPTLFDDSRKQLFSQKEVSSQEECVALRECEHLRASLQRQKARLAQVQDDCLQTSCQKVKLVEEIALAESQHEEAATLLQSLEATVGRVSGGSVCTASKMNTRCDVVAGLVGDKVSKRTAAELELKALRKELQDMKLELSSETQADRERTSEETLGAIAEAAVCRTSIEEMKAECSTSYRCPRRDFGDRKELADLNGRCTALGTSSRKDLFSSEKRVFAGPSTMGHASHGRTRKYAGVSVRDDKCPQQ